MFYVFLNYAKGQFEVHTKFQRDRATFIFLRSFETAWSANQFISDLKTAK